ncbi:cytochrome P450 4C1-like [Onthophagus taurus]|uniref:cytochrome P450 4C1-like n=1 Tax=Onthophagus taurus TaxID=166361 RepID=UPI0039BDB6A3
MQNRTMDIGSIFSQLQHYLPSLWIIYCLVLLLIVYKLIRGFNEMKYLKKIPGAKGFPIVGDTKLISQKPADLFQTLRDYAKIYNPIFKLTVGFSSVIVLTSPDDIEAIISQMKNLQKGTVYIPLNNWLGEGLLLSNGAKWQHRRKLLTPTFHFTILNQYTKIFIDESKKLINSIEKLNNESIDVLSVITDFTLQSICETAMGTKLEEIRSGEKYKEAIYTTGNLTVDRYVTPWQHNDFLHKLTPNYWKTRSILNYLHKFTSNVIKNRESSFNLNDIIQKENKIESRKRLAMLDLLLLAKLKGNNIDDKGIQEEVDTFMFEGHDTTAASVTFTLMLLASYKDVQEKVCEELKDILNETKRDFNMEDLNEMKYLERVIKESLRLYPSVPFIGRVLSEDIETPSGYYLPKDTSVLLGIYDMHHDPKYYKDPENFDPDRFLAENIIGKHPYSYIPFSAGPRNCIGQKFAMLEMKAVIATILRNFELFPVDTPGTIQLQTDIILRSVKPILIDFQPKMNNSF